MSVLAIYFLTEIAFSKLIMEIVMIVWSQCKHFVDNLEMTVRNVNKQNRIVTTLFRNL